jgi:hypothetical protein
VAFRPHLAAGLAFAGILEKQTLQKKSSHIFGKRSLTYCKSDNFRTWSKESKEIEVRASIACHNQQTLKNAD